MRALDGGLLRLRVDQRGRLLEAAGVGSQALITECAARRPLSGLLAAGDRRRFEAIVAERGYEGVSGHSWDCLDQEMQLLIFDSSEADDGVELRAALAYDDQRLRSELSSRYFRSVVHSSIDGIITTALDMTITSCNQGWERLFGIPAEWCIGEKLIATGFGAHLDELFFDIEDQIYAGKTYRAMLRAPRFDGFFVDVSLVASPIAHEPGRISGISIVCRDIGERIAAEERLLDHAEQLRRSNGDLEIFAAAASHDLQEPLLTVSACARVLTGRLEGKVSEEDLALIEGMAREGSAASKRVADLLALARIDTHEAPEEGADSNAALREALRLVESALAARGGEVRAAKLPDLHLHESHLVLLFQNLISNSIKFCPSDRNPRIEISAETCDVEGYLWLCLRDNGPGIPEGERARLLQPFERGRHRKGTGTGIGLFLIRRIVDAYGGELVIRSSPAGGAEFRMMLPLAAIAADEGE